MSRATREAAAAAFLERNAGAMGDLLLKVSGDLADELAGLTRGQQDARLAAEMAYRLDRATDWQKIIPDATVGLVVELLDFFGYFLASLGVIAALRKLERRGLIASSLREQLEAEGEWWGRQRRRRVERRIRRLEG